MFFILANNGGAAALVAYVICAVLVAIPLFLYELIIGQHTRLSTIRCYQSIAPRWKGIGYAAGAMLFLVLSYYAQVVAYTLPYVVASCESPLPWLEKGADAYWSNTILNKYAEGETVPTGLGGIETSLAVSLFCFWIIVLLSASFGKDILAQITYVTVYMPVVLMLILVIRAPMLEGAGDGMKPTTNVFVPVLSHIGVFLLGIKFYIGKFEASKLGDLSVWATACSQILFSLSPGFGTAISYSSYTDRKEDVYRICLITAIANSAFSIIGGFGIFSILGHVAFRENLPVEEVASRSGTGLAFVTIAEAMQHFGDLSNVMSVLFFVMLLTLGLDSAYAWLETLVSYVDDFIAERGWSKRPKWQLTIGVVLVQFLVGLLFATRRGNDLLDVTDFYVGTLFLLVVCCLEALMIQFDFGWERLSLALRLATYGNKSTPSGRSVFPSYLCRLDFHVTVPLITGFLAIYNIQKVIKDPYGGYPSGILAVGWTFFGILIVTALTTLWKCGEGTLKPIEELEDELEEEKRAFEVEATKTSANDMEEGVEEARAY